MQQYIILRRNGFTSLEDLEEKGKVSASVGDTPGSGVRWIRSYVLNEESGDVGTVCVYEGENVEAIREHAAKAGLPCDEVIATHGTVVVRPDPIEAAA
jgi:hypothetical protein